MKELKIKVVASDFDGTLLRSDNTIGRRTVEAIREFLSRGGKFLVATGRMHFSINNRLAELGLGGLDLPVISYQGALVKTSDTDKLLLNRPITKADALEIMEYLDKVEKLYCHTYLNDRIIVAEEKDWTRMYADVIGADFDVVGDLKRYVTANGYPEDGRDRGLNVCHKVISLMEADKLPAVMARCNERFAGRVQFNNANPNLMEGVSVSAGKDKAIEYLIEPYGMDLSHVMAIGDSLNDYTMVSRAGMGVAMGNAVDELKAVAQAVTLSNDQDGVAEAIERFCF